MIGIPMPYWPPSPSSNDTCTGFGGGPAGLVWVGGAVELGATDELGETTEPVADGLLDVVELDDGACVQAVRVTIARALTSAGKNNRVRFNTPERYLAGLR
jgi:hypothetical protein